MAKNGKLTEVGKDENGNDLNSLQGGENVQYGSYVELQNYNK